MASRWEVVKVHRSMVGKSNASRQVAGGNPMAGTLVVRPQHLLGYW